METFGNVTLEAMACGLPVVVDKYCSGHLVEDGMTGFGVESLDENAPRYVVYVDRLVNFGNDSVEQDFENP